MPDGKQEFRYFSTAPGRTPLAYRDSGGDGPVVIFLHGFAGFSCTWEPLLAHFPAGYRTIRPEGLPELASDEEHDSSVNYDLAELIGALILAENWSGVTLVANGTGAESAFLLLQETALRFRISRLVLLNPAGLQPEIPRYIEEIAALSPKGALLRLANAELLAYMMLEHAYASPSRISDAMLLAYAERLSNRECVARTVKLARAYRLPDAPQLDATLRSLDIPVLIVWGAGDRILPLRLLDSYRAAIPGAQIRILPDCGHVPQEEMPVATAAAMKDFLDREMVQPDLPLAVEETPPERLKLRRLFDRWSFGSVLFMVVLKTLQGVRRLGVRAQENGWRKVSSIFLRHEYSKFVLGVFRLTYASPWGVPADREEAEERLTRRLIEYLMRKREWHWSVEPGVFFFRRRKILFCDVVCAQIDHLGNLLRLQPFFDERHPDWLELPPERLTLVLDKIMEICNRARNNPAATRPRWIARELRRWVKWDRSLVRGERRQVAHVIERVMSAMFVYHEVLPADPAERERMRLVTPDLKKYRHPGWGMLCVVVRLTADFAEADLWCQFHHVTVDGAPMQEMLRELKQEWGEAGALIYPALHVPVTRPETMYCGDGIFRARCYVDFEPLLEVRAWLNEHYRNQMNGPASLAGLLMWGLAQHDFFKSKKMLLPVDGGSNNGERELELLFIRPGIYANPESPLDGFLRFQRELNRRLHGTRSGRSESHEFLELCSMVHPFFYHVANWLVPRSLAEIVGTMGISIIRDAEMFISPLTDFQINGFMSVGSITMPTANGKRAGAVCICGSRPQTRSYLEALSALITRYPHYLQLPSGWQGK